MTTMQKTKGRLPSEGLEPSIFRLGGGRLIHWATRAVLRIGEKFDLFQLSLLSRLRPAAIFPPQHPTLSNIFRVLPLSEGHLWGK